MILYGVGTGNDCGSTNHISDGGGRVALKKGPWTATEDEILAAYVRENGEGNWNALQKHTGLARCGKSCRLRWANHLRPNLKKGSFTNDEERLIIQLHAQLGNKWARMAAQLPGRTDNEIKNYWNTRLKRLQRQGLPLYPPDVIPNHQFHPHPQHHHQQHQQMYYHQHSSQSNTPSSSPLPSPTPLNANPSSSFTFQTTNASPANFLHPLSPHTPTTPQTPSQLSSMPSPLPLSSPLSSPLNNRNPTLPLFNNNNTNFTFPRPPPLLQPSSSLFARRYNNSNTPLDYTNRVSTAPFSPISRDSYTSFLTLPYTSSSGLNTPTDTYHNTNNSYSSFSLNPSPSSYPSATSSPSFLRSHYTPNSSPTSFHTNPVYPMKQDLPTNQTHQICDFNNVENFTYNEKHNKTNLQRRNISCSLLEDVMEEAEALGDRSGGRPPKRRQLTTSSPLNSSSKNNNDNDFFSVTFEQYDASENICSLQDLKSKEEKSLEINTMQEDIAKLLDWGSDSGEISNGQSSGVTDDNLVLDVHQMASLFPADSTAAANDQHNNNNNNNFSWDDLD
ncbi:unnamed protein product [Eruca vesicaria subsp. sativa]|uniref:Uncharacterized protein n=1 Tax=Eruca vesicaria subsp. sativa TaxID=29727 RepID=A0ABC8L1Y2_ERUVS|nr:unnamed protein product [Eruca vesicaria subsp. sativa]